MTPERWRQINDLFHAAIERDAGGRQALLESTGKTDPELAAEVRSLLAVHESTGEFLDEVSTRAAAQNEQYLELMEMPTWNQLNTITKDLN